MAQAWHSRDGWQCWRPATMGVLDPGSGSGSQVWTPGANDSLGQQASGLCLDDPGGNPANGTQPRIWSCNGGNNQAWRLPGV